MTTTSNLPKTGGGRPPGAKSKNGNRISKLKVDKFRREKLTADENAELDEFVRYRPPNMEIYQWLCEHGYDGQLCSVQNWYRATYPTGEQAKAINELARSSAGIDHRAVLEIMLTRTTAMANSAFNQLEKLCEKGIIDGADLDQLFKLIPALNRELRATSSQLGELNYIRDRAELELAGAYRMLEGLRQIFDDNPAILEPLKTAANSVLAEIEGR